MDKLTIVGQHDDRTIAQMRNCLRDIILLGAGADEMPPVYRPLRSVLAAHQDTFEIETVLLPRIVVMAGSGEHDPYKD